MPKLISANDIMETCGVCRVTAIRMMREMNPIQVGMGRYRQHLLVTEEEFRKWLDDRTAKGLPLTNAYKRGNRTKKLERR
ncbi:MAG: hypothetical protein IIZ78_24850 [Clostridiales bacterium]|jgi:hypothetical protein|nr:hypothetical protein [Clostridiales bacterium]